MFLYNSNVTNKLLATAKSRLQIEQDPDLCKLLENPYIKDEVELAIRYNEYKLSYPDAAQQLVDYFYMHGPELDTGTLIEWRDTITKDPELAQIAAKNEVILEQIWEEKKNNPSKNYSWLGNLFDCLSKPCMYSQPVSTAIGSIGDEQAKYSLKNTGGDIGLSTLVGLPTQMLTKIPRYLAQSITQLTDMIANGVRNIYDTVVGNPKTFKEDPYIIKDTELISGDLLSDTASRMGDCFRIYEYKRRYNPYDPEQNNSGAEPTGIIGKTGLYSPNGNAIDTPKNRGNITLDPNATAKSINVETIKNLNDDDTIPFVVTTYNGAITSDGILYGDDDFKKQCEKPKSSVSIPEDGFLAGSREHNQYTIPACKEGLKYMVKTDRTISLGCASKAISVQLYFYSVLKKKGIDPVQYFKEKFKNPKSEDAGGRFYKAYVEGYKNAKLFVTLKFPIGIIRTFPIYDCGTGGGNADLGYPWVDIVGHYFLTAEGSKVGKLISKGQHISSPNPIPEVMKASDLAIFKAYGGNITGFKIYGATEEHEKSLVNALFFFSDDILTKYNLDPEIFGNPEKYRNKKAAENQDTTENKNTTKVENDSAKISAILQEYTESDEIAAKASDTNFKL